LFCAAFAPFVVACGSSEPIVIHPKTPEVAASECPVHPQTFTLARTDDRRGYADVRNVGFTQTGLYNVKTSLRTDRPAAQVVQDALVGAMRRCGMLSQSSDARALAVDLLALQVSESDTLTSETMSGDVRYDVLVLEPGSSQPVARFAVTGHSQHSAVDTTDFAEQTLSETIASSLPSFLREVWALSTEIGQPGAAVASDAPAGALASEGEAPVRVSVRPLSDDEARARFGTTLTDKQILGVEIRVERASTAAHDVRFRRQEFRLTFAGGATLFPLDPTKLRERNRFGVPLFAYGGIVPLYMGSMNMSGQTRGFAGSTVEELTLPGETHELRGTLFFDLEGAPGQPVRMDVSYEDLVTHRLRAVAAPYGASP
jgi:hypothetical protein